MLDQPRIAPPIHALRSSNPGALAMLRLIRGNTLEMWTRHAYEQPAVVGSFMGRVQVLLNDPDAIAHVLVRNVTNYQRPGMTRRVLAPLVGDGLLLSEGAAWRHQRRTIAPLLAPRAMPGADRARGRRRRGLSAAAGRPAGGRPAAGDAAHGTRDRRAVHVLAGDGGARRADAGLADALRHSALAPDRAGAAAAVPAQPAGGRPAALPRGVDGADRPHIGRARRAARVGRPAGPVRHAGGGARPGDGRRVHARAALRPGSDDDPGRARDDGADAVLVVCACWRSRRNGRAGWRRRPLPTRMAGRTRPRCWLGCRWRAPW